MAFDGYGAFSSAARKYQSGDEQVQPITPIEDFSTAGVDSIGGTAQTNFEIGTQFGRDGLQALGEKKRADDLVAIYKERARQINSQKGGFFKTLGQGLGFAGQIASFIPGGQAIGIGLGAASKAAGMIG